MNIDQKEAQNLIMGLDFSNTNLPVEESTKDRHFEDNPIYKKAEKILLQEQQKQELVIGLDFSENNLANEEEKSKGLTNNKLIMGLVFEDDNTKTITPFVNTIPKTAYYGQFSGIPITQKEYNDISNVYYVSKDENIKFNKEFIIYDGNLVIVADGKNEIISNFYIEPKKIIVYKDMETSYEEYHFVAVLNGESEKKQIRLLKRELYDSSWISNKLGIKYFVYNETFYNDFKLYIADKFKYVEREVHYINVGWRKIGSQYVYLHSQGAIGLRQKVIVDTDKILEVNHSINNTQSFNDSLNMLKLADYKKTVPMYLFMHIAVLKTLFIESNVKPQFALWLVGLTGSRKTSVAKCFFNIFNSSKDYISGNFKDTVASLEKASYEYRDSCLIIDDFYPSESKLEFRTMENTASEMLRRYGDTIAKSRMDSKMNSIKKYPPQGMLVITGETLLKGHSTAARYLSIEIDKDDINLELLSYFQEERCTWSTHFYNFIKWASYNAREIIKEIHINFIEYRKDKKMFSHGRLDEMFIIYKIIIRIVLQYANQIGAISGYEVATMESAWIGYVFEAISEHSKNVLDQQPTIIFIRTLSQLLEGGIIKLAQKNTEEKNEYGYEDENYYYISSEEVIKKMNNHFTSLNIRIDKNSLIKELANLGIIVETTEGTGKVRRTQKLGSNKDGRRFIKIIKYKMQDILAKIIE